MSYHKYPNSSIISKDCLGVLEIVCYALLNHFNTCSMLSPRLIKRECPHLFKDVGTH